MPAPPTPPETAPADAWIGALDTRPSGPIWRIGDNVPVRFQRQTTDDHPDRFAEAVSAPGPGARGIDEALEQLLDQIPTSEFDCATVLIEVKWPGGYLCQCGETRYYRDRTRPRVFQCVRCRSQRSITAGSVMHRSHLPLRAWYVAATCMAHAAGVSASAVSRWLGVRYESVWRMMQKIRGGLKEFPALERGNSDGAVTVTVPCRLHFGAPPVLHRSDNLAVLRVYSSAGEIDDITDVQCEGDFRLLDEWMSFGNAIPAVHLAKHLGPSLMATYRSVSFKWMDRYLQEIRFRARYREKGGAHALLQRACSTPWRPWRLHDPPLWWPMRYGGGQLGHGGPKRRRSRVPMPLLPPEPEPWPDEPLSADDLLLEEDPP